MGIWQPLKIWGEPDTWEAKNMRDLALQIACLRNERDKVEPDWPDGCLRGYLWFMVEDLVGPLHEVHYDDDELSLNWSHNYDYTHNFAWPIPTAKFLQWLDSIDLEGSCS